MTTLLNKLAQDMGVALPDQESEIRKILEQATGAVPRQPVPGEAEMMAGAGKPGMPGGEVEDPLDARARELKARQKELGVKKQELSTQGSEVDVQAREYALKQKQLTLEKKQADDARKLQEEQAQAQATQAAAQPAPQSLQDRVGQMPAMVAQAAGQAPAPQVQKTAAESTLDLERKMGGNPTPDEVQRQLALAQAAAEFQNNFRRQSPAMSAGPAMAAQRNQLSQAVLRSLTAARLGIKNIDVSSKITGDTDLPGYGKLKVPGARPPPGSELKTKPETKEPPMNATKTAAYIPKGSILPGTDPKNRGGSLQTANQMNVYEGARADHSLDPTMPATKGIDDLKYLGQRGLDWAESNPDIVGAATGGALGLGAGAMMGKKNRWIKMILGSLLGATGGYFAGPKVLKQFQPKTAAAADAGTETETETGTDAGDGTSEDGLFGRGKPPKKDKGVVDQAVDLANAHPRTTRAAAGAAAGASVAAMAGKKNRAVKMLLGSLLGGTLGAASPEIEQGVRSLGTSLGGGKKKG